MATWNLNDVYRFEDTEKLISELKKSVDKFKSNREKLSPKLSVDEFMEILKEKEKISEYIGRLLGFAELWLSENTSDPKRTAHYARISEICTDAGNDTLFFNLWFRDLNDKDADKFIKGSGKYHYVLDRIRAFKDHTLKEKEEQIIALKDLSAGEALTKLYDIIANRFRFEWDGKLISQEEINQYKQSPVRKERVDAYEKVLGKYGEEEAVLGDIYIDIANDWRNENIKIRKFKSPISVRNLGNDIPDKAVDAMLNVIRKNIKLFQEYFELKKKVCNLPKMDRYDLSAPYSVKTKDYPYDEAKKIVLETYNQFSPKAYELAKKIFDEDHVHSDIQPNKKSGAFCFTVLKNITPYILLNHVNKLNDLFTMMHEFGHGIHGLSATEQTQYTFHSAIPLAETASIFGEMLLAQRLLKESKDAEEKKAVLVKLLDGQYASIARQGYFVLFEIDAHNKIAEGATIHDLNDIYLANLKEQFGDVVPVGDFFQHEWKYIPHIYHTPFYCYGYAFGNLLVLALYRMYEEQGDEFITKYMKILAYGGSESPAKILEEVGIDITKESFWQQGFDIIKTEIEELRRLA
ncbi:M3 family oligoendopeptidase [Candidatus Woesearchaeota archaeon]|nr:M3 family oligoendopeptidase [Candidatus Woesearchaeota archaeon]